MRLVVGATLVDRAIPRLISNPPVVLAIASVLLICGGILLILGLWTPVAGTLAVLVELWKIFVLPDDRWVYLLVATLCAGLAMIGPGAWSVDACLYGWKRIDDQDL